MRKKTNDACSYPCGYMCGFYLYIYIFGAHAYNILCLQAQLYHGVGRKCSIGTELHTHLDTNTYIFIYIYEKRIRELEG